MKYALYLSAAAVFRNTKKDHSITDLQPEVRKCWDILKNLNKMKTKQISNHMSQYFIHNRTDNIN